jgi:mono/diheme cytochrome c family protein
MLARQFAVSIVLLAIASGGAMLAQAPAQDAGRTVADEVYSDAQAARGAAAYESACSGCHRADLGGGTGPALKNERFARQFAGKELRALFTKVATTMPRNAPGSLGDNVNLDLVAYLLRENGFPAGSEELTAEGLDGVRVLAGRRKPPPAVGDFSYVEVVGCLTQGPENTWLLTKATAPAAATPSGSPDTAKPLGAETFHLVDAMAYAPAEHRGQKMYVRGLLIKLAGEQRMTISAFETVSPNCSE